MKRIIYTLILSISMSSCTRNHQIGTHKWDKLAYDIIAEDIALDSTILEFSNIVIIDSLIIIRQKHADQQYAVYKLSENIGEYIGEFGNFGNGPADFRSSKLYYIAENNAIVLVGFNPYGKIGVISLDNPANLFNVVMWRIYRSSLLGSQMSVTPIDTASVVMQYLGEQDKMYATLTLGQSEIKCIDISYPDKMNEVSAINKAMEVYGGNGIQKRPRYNQFVNSSNYGHFVKVFSLENNNLVNEFDLFEEIPKYTLNSQGHLEKDIECKIGFSIDVTEHYIYCGDPKLTIKDHNRAGEKNGYPAGYVKEIYVSDWIGNPVAKLLLDRPIGYCVIDDNDNYLYAASYNSQTLEENLVRFKLPKYNN